MQDLPQSGFEGFLTAASPRHQCGGVMTRRGRLLKAGRALVDAPQYR